MAKRALLIGVSQYEAGLPPLAAAPRDVRAMARVLQDPQLEPFDSVATLVDPDLEAMQIAIAKLFQSCQKGDLALLYFSGHGITDDNGKLYLATHHTSKDTFKANAVAASWIQDIMREYGHQRQHVLILDCCYSGAFAEGWQAKSVDVNLRGQLDVEGSVVLTSSTSTQKSFEQDEAELSLYTSYIVQGIESGAAEQDGDGYISADELHEYAKAKVQAAKPNMKPEIYGQKQGIKIKFVKAKTDSKLEYRRKVGQYAENGEIRLVGRDILDVYREEMGLSEEIARAIEDEVLEPDRKRIRNLQRYRKTLEKTVKQQYPLTDRTQNDLQDFQEKLGLRDEDVRSIYEQVTSPYAAQAVERQRQAELQQQQQVADSARRRQIETEQQKRAELEKQRQLEAERQQQAKLEKQRQAEQQRLQSPQKEAERRRLKEEAERQGQPPPPSKLLSCLTRREFIAAASLSGIGLASALVWENVKPKPNPISTTSGFKSDFRKDGATVDFGNGVSLELSAIPSGKFVMGTSLGDKRGEGNERPQHEVAVPAFYMGKYEVTQAQWQAVMGNNPSQFAGNLQRPVERVSWHDAQTFCQKLSEKTGKQFRLPSEAEWEYACRAGTTTAYYFGDNENILGDYAWYDKNSGGQTHPVGQKKPNAWGLYDMHGNVWEWCQDDWHNNYQGAPKDGSAWINNSGTKSLRGGSWDDPARNCRSACRGGFGADNRFHIFGFRVVCGVR